MSDRWLTSTGASASAPVDPTTLCSAGKLPLGLDIVCTNWKNANSTRELIKSRKSIGTQKQIANELAHLSHLLSQNKTEQEPGLLSALVVMRERELRCLKKQTEDGNDKYWLEHEII